MKEIGEKLRDCRKQNGVSLEEVSSDLGINVLELECLENGNFKAFKDVYELKKNIRMYAKYLGLDELSILDDFNDYLFEKTSRISLLDIQRVKSISENDDNNKMTSPYTNIKPSRYNFAPIVLIVVLLMFISLVVYLVLTFVRQKEDITHELKSGRIVEVVYEFTE